MDMRLSVTYKTCSTSPREKTGDIITFAQFEEGNLLSETCEDEKRNEKIGDEYDDDYIMQLLLSV